MNQNQEIEIKDRTDEEVEIDLLELFSYYLDRIRWIAGGFLVCALLAGLVTHFAITPKYTATSKMYMVSSSSQSVVDLTDLNIGQSISSDYVELLQTRPIIEGVIREQNLSYTYKEMLNMLNISVINDTRIIKIDATSTDKREAMTIANAPMRYGQAPASRASSPRQRRWRRSGRPGRPVLWMPSSCSCRGSGSTSAGTIWRPRNCSGRGSRCIRDARRSKDRNARRAIAKL